MKMQLSLGLVGFLCLFSMLPAQAQNQSLSTLRSVVWVQCDQRQGSGTIINGEQGYVLTDGHVALDYLSGKLASVCTVAFVNEQTFQPQYYYHANILRSVFNEKLGQDFAILQITTSVGQALLPRPFPFLKTNEFIQRGYAVEVLGYSGQKDELTSADGVVKDFIGGYIQTTAEVAPGDSGGAAIDQNGNLIGVPTRIVTITSAYETQSTTTFELVDVRAVMNWLDAQGPNVHDQYFTHQDYARYHGTASFIDQSDLGCEALARSPEVSSVFCLLPDGQRLAFPTDLTFFSWFPDFSGVIKVSLASLAQYSLTRNATFRPGMLVKLQTAPEVYMVTDSFGSLRYIPSEQKAIELWGENWASLVHDVPDAFWTNYTIGSPIE